MSCLFDSLYKYVGVGSSQQLRKQICDYLKSNPSILDDIQVSEVIKWENGMDINTYIDKMERSSTWGGAIEVKCFCELYNLAVTINHNNRQIEFFPSSGKYTGIITLNYTGNHYY